MKNLIVVFALSCMFSACSMQKVESQTQTDNIPNQSTIINPPTTTPVLVELFTSEGCSSCPAADRALAFLEKEQPYAQAEIITLALHVDYWNRLGWKDEYSSAQFSQRQEYYAEKFKLSSVYTPQMVVDGGWEFTGSNLGTAAQTIMESAKTPKGKADVAIKGEKAVIKFSELPKHSNSTVYFVIAEDNLISNVKSGENAGKSLEHISVVRILENVGKISPETDRFETEYSFSVNAQWKRKNLKIIVFVQDNESRKIIGLDKISVE